MSITRDEFEALARRVRAIEADPLLAIVNAHTHQLDVIEQTMAKHLDVQALRQDLGALRADLADTASKEDVAALNAKLDQIIRRLP